MTIDRRIRGGAFAFALGIFLEGQGGLAFAAEYRLEWEQRGVALELRTFALPSTTSARVGETALIEKDSDFPVKEELVDGKVRLAPASHAVLLLTARNPGKKEAAFFVAPHESNPIDASLGFQFYCLCNGHVYRVPPGKTWYRVILLKALPEQGESGVNLKHVIVSAEDAPKLAHEREKKRLKKN